MSHAPFGRLVRHHRKAHGLSQEELARRASVSVRHLSFIENGKTQPGRDTVLALAAAIGVGDQGAFLEAAGFLAPYAEIDLEDPAMRELAQGLVEVVEASAQPALIHDRHGTILRRNDLFDAVLGLFIESPSVRPGGGHHTLAALRPFVRNWDDVATLYRRRLFGELVRGGVELGDAMLEELLRMWEAPEKPSTGPPHMFTPLHLESETHRLCFRFMTTTLGTPQDIPLRNFRLVIFLPADTETTTQLDRIRAGVEAPTLSG